MVIISRLFIALAIFLALSGNVFAAEADTTQDSSITSATDFTIRSGDVLQVTVWKEDGLDREVLVLPDGTITFPLVGTIKVEDMTPVDMQAAIRAKLQATIPDATVTVSVKAPLGHKISVLGQVQKPGEIIMGSNMSVMQALSQVGGLTPYASEDIIIIRQTKNGKESIEYPYDDISRGRHLDKDIDLKAGDVVFVSTSGIL